MPDLPQKTSNLSRLKDCSLTEDFPIEQYQKDVIQLFSFDPETLILDLLQGEVEGLSIIIIPTRELCQQYHNMIVENNTDLKNNSMIVRSVEELMQSSAIVMFVYKGMLLGAIRIQEQEGISTLDYEPIYQRGSLIVHPQFRGKAINNISLMDYLLKEINKIALDKNRMTYGIGKLKSMINRNIAAGSIAMEIDNLIKLSDEFYYYVVESRGQDFYDLKNTENKSDYHILINGVLFDRLKKSDINNMLL